MIPTTVDALLPRCRARLLAPLLLSVLAAGCATGGTADRSSGPPAVIEARDAKPPAEVQPPAPAPAAVAETSPVLAGEQVQTAPLIPTLQEPQDGRYIGYIGSKWIHDYGVTQGRCDPVAAGQALGSDKNARTVALLVGAPLVLALGTALDERDRACFGHALELARVGQTVNWSVPSADIRYRVTPTRHYVKGKDPCREFSVAVTSQGKTRSIRSGACRTADGKWESVD